MKLLAILFFIGVGMVLGTLFMVFWVWWLLKLDDDNSVYSEDKE